MIQKPSRLAIALTYLGAIPFLIAAFIGLSPYINIPESLGGEIVFSGFKAKTLIHTYAVVILSFLAGIQWGISLNHDKPNKYLMASNLLAILAWFSLMAFASKLAISFLLCGFIIALLVDRVAYKNQLIPTWFWHLRKKISLIVCVSFLIVLLAT